MLLCKNKINNKDAENPGKRSFVARIQCVATHRTDGIRTPLAVDRLWADSGLSEMGSKPTNYTLKTPAFEVLHSLGEGALGEAEIDAKGSKIQHRRQISCAVPATGN
jgi:hypothetical protein